MRNTQDKADDARDRSLETRQEGHEKIQQIKQDITTIREEGDRAIEEANRRIAEAVEQSKEASARATQYDSEADALQAEIDSLTDGDERDKAIQRQTELREKAEREREKLDTLSERSTELHSFIRDVNNAVLSQTLQLEDRSITIEAEADRLAREYESRARQLENSIGGGVPPHTEQDGETEDKGLKAFVTKIFGGKKQKFVPNGAPLAASGEVTEEMIKEQEGDAIREWNRNNRLPSGILEARVASDEEAQDV